MYTLNDKNREQNVCKINMCLRVKNCCHKNRQNFPVDLIQSSNLVKVTGTKRKLALEERKK